MKKIIALVLALMLLLGTMSFASADKLSEIKDAGKVIVGANVMFPPYEFYWTNPETGMEEYAGFDMALAKGLAEELGVELVISDQAFSGLITALSNGELDMIISGMSAKPERREVVDFSDPYFSGTQILMVRAEDVDALTTVESMTGKKIGAQTGSLQATILEEQFAASEPSTMDQIPLMVLDLMQGSIDGLLLTDTVANQYINLYEGKLAISSVPVVYNAPGSAVAVQKQADGGNETLLAVINDYLARVKADGTFDGWLEDAYAKSASLLAAE